MNARAARKSHSHERILESAAPLLKIRGMPGATLPDIMRQAGLTTGGFYAHFSSKDALIEQALGRALEARRTRFEQVVKADRWRDRIRIMLRKYLAPAHRDDVAGGCPLPALLTDVAREEIGRDVATREVEALVRALADRDPRRQSRAARDAAIGTVALMVGGLVVSRAVQAPLSDEILHACERFGEAALKTVAGPVSQRRVDPGA